MANWNRDAEREAGGGLPHVPWALARAGIMLAEGDVHGAQEVQS